MIDTFKSGYTKALIDLREEFKNAKFLFPKSKVKQLEYVRSLISYLLEHRDKRNLYRDYGGAVWKKVSPKGTVLSISETKEANDDTD